MFYAMQHYASVTKDHWFLTLYFQLDVLFTRCNPAMKRAVEFHTYYELVLRRFKQSCAELGFHSEPKASLEDCMVGIKDKARLLLKEQVQVISVFISCQFLLTLSIHRIRLELPQCT